MSDTEAQVLSEFLKNTKLTGQKAHGQGPLLCVRNTLTGLQLMESIWIQKVREVRLV